MSNSTIKDRNGAYLTVHKTRGRSQHPHVREHSSVDYQTPFAYLKQQQPNFDDRVRLAQPFIFDDVSVQVGPWSGYDVLAQHQIKELKHTLTHNAIANLKAGYAIKITTIRGTICWDD